MQIGYTESTDYVPKHIISGIRGHVPTQLAKGNRYLNVRSR
jgi:hypothetical protein